MAAQTGPSVSAIRAAQAALAAQRTAAGDADRVLAKALGDAHAATVAGINRLDAIAAEIETAVAGPAGFAIDTPLGAREFQKFLIAKQRDILAVVAEAHQLDDVSSTRLDSLRSAYLAPDRD